MIRGIAGMALLQHDLLAGIDAADAAGYELMELWAGTVAAYLDSGGTAEAIKAKLTALRAAKEKDRRELAAARQSLRQVLTLRQEAHLVLHGLLE